MSKITIGRLRSKEGRNLKDLDIIINTDLKGWVFISQLKDKVSQQIYNRFAMLYIKDEEVI